MRINIARIGLLAITSLCSLMPISTMAQKGQTSVGLRGGFTTRNTTASAGLYLSYRFSEHFRMSPKIDYAFRHNGTDAFSFNFDTEMPIALNAEKNVNFYPIAGLNYSTFSTHFQITDNDESVDSSERTNHFGFNLGAGIEYFATPTLRLALESKCLLMKQFTGGWFNISIGYVF